MSEMEQVDDAILAALAMPMAPAKALRARAARLADLYEVQARLYAEAGQDTGTIVPSVYRTACELASKRLVERSKFFRTQAGARK